MSAEAGGKAPLERSDAAKLVAEPRVSVLMITYNHAAYLAEAIEGVISQRCDFPFELIIGEDASSDATREIAFTYQEKYPEIIRVIHSIENVGMNENARRIFRAARAPLLAFCEGDDYWCYETKLEDQIAVMNDPAIGAVHSDWVRARLQDGRWVFDLQQSVHRRVPLRLLQGAIFPTWHFPRILRTCTMLVRRAIIQEMLDSDIGRKTYRFGDSVANAFITSKWKIAYLPAITAVYRESPNSVLRSGAAARVAFYRSALEFDSDARVFFGLQSGYPAGYRWEHGIALLLWAARARDWNAVREAIADLWRTFGVIEFLRTGIKTSAMRLPTLRAQKRINVK